MLAVALCDSTTVALPPCDSTVAAAAFHHSTVIAMGSCVSAVVTTVAGAPSTRVAADRLWPPIFFARSQ